MKIVASHAPAAGSKALAHRIKEALFVAALASAAYVAWVVIESTRPVDVSEAWRPDPRALSPRNRPYIGIGIARTIEAFGGNPAEVLD